MSAEDTERLEALMKTYGIAVLEIEEGDTRIHLRREQAQPLPPPSPSPAQRVLTASSFGRFLLKHPASSADAPGLPREAGRGEIVAYLAVGMLLRPVIADRDCTLRRTLLPEGAMAGFGDPLFEL